MVNKVEFVEGKHGEWIVNNRKKVVVCSNCTKAIPFVVILGEAHKIIFDYCPYCGEKNG